MIKKVIPIKEMSAIESVLNDGFVGISAFRSDDNIVQKTTTYLYLDKNIYIYFSPGDDDFKKIKFDRISSFSILKNNQPANGSHLYSILSITISGKIKPVDDAKVLDEIGKNYLKKYKLKKADLASFAGAVMIDTEEIQAFQESGG
jgi:hypothetical protein